MKGLLISQSTYTKSIDLFRLIAVIIQILISDFGLITLQTLDACQ